MLVLAVFVSACPFEPEAAVHALARVVALARALGWTRSTVPRSTVSPLVPLPRRLPLPLSWVSVPLPALQLGQLIGKWVREGAIVPFDAFSAT